MNEIAETILTIIVVVVLLLLFYMYMNSVRDQYIYFEKGQIEKLPWWVTPVWVKDAWDPTWTVIQRAQAKLSVII